MVVCDGCGHPLANMSFACARCSEAMYCSTVCQKRHWKAFGHSKSCGKPVTTCCADTTATPADSVAGVFTIVAPDVRVRVVGLTSAVGQAINGQEGTVQRIEKKKNVKAGRVAVILDGATKPRSISLNNLRRADAPAPVAGVGTRVFTTQDCPVCLDNADDHCDAQGNEPAACSVCGQMFCGPCKVQIERQNDPTCPTCRATLIIPEKLKFSRLWALLHGRSPGRHTAWAQWTLGVMYDLGGGVARDQVEGRKWMRRSAEHGYIKAQVYMMNEVGVGDGVPVDDEESHKWYQMSQSHGDDVRSAASVYANATLGATLDAAKGGCMISQHRLGDMFASGTGVPVDVAKACQWYQAAANQGDAHAQYQLALIYYYGDELHDVPKGVALLRLAVAQGQADAKRILKDNMIDDAIDAPGMRVRVVGLTSSVGRANNGRKGTVQKAQTTKNVKAGRAAVILDGDAKPSSISLNNLRRADGLKPLR